MADLALKMSKKAVKLSNETSLSKSASWKSRAANEKQVGRYDLSCKLEKKHVHS